MAIQVQKINSHWHFFLALERDLEQLSRYIEFNESNFTCFSLEIARVLLAAGAEVDVVCKQLCKKLNTASRASKIGPYQTEITTAIPDISRWEVLAPRFGLILHPWDEWSILSVICRIQEVGGQGKCVILPGEGPSVPDRCNCDS